MMRCKICKKVKSERDELSGNESEKDKFVSKDLCLECSKKPPPKFYYDIKVETMLPSTVTYRVYAETPEKAVELIRNAKPISVQYKLIGKKDIKLTVYDAGCSMIRLIQSLLR